MGETTQKGGAGDLVCRLRMLRQLSEGCRSFSPDELESTLLDAEAALLRLSAHDSPAKRFTEAEREALQAGRAALTKSALDVGAYSSMAAAEQTAHADVLDRMLAEAPTADAAADA